MALKSTKQSPVDDQLLDEIMSKILDLPLNQQSMFIDALTRRLDQYHNDAVTSLRAELAIRRTLLEDIGHIAENLNLKIVDLGFLPILNKA